MLLSNGFFKINRCFYVRAFRWDSWVHCDHFIVGFSRLSIRQIFPYDGTHVAVEHCINQNQSDLISDTLIKNLCVREESQKVNTIQLNGRAGPKKNTSFSGNIKNNFEKTIITGFVIEVRHYVIDLEKIPDDKDLDDLNIPPAEENIYVIKDIWLEPGQDHSFEFFERDMNVIPNMSIYENEAVEWIWFVSEATGVQVQTR